MRYAYIIAIRHLIPEFASTPTKQWLQVQVDNEIVIDVLLYPGSISSPCSYLLKQIWESIYI